MSDIASALVHLSGGGGARQPDGRPAEAPLPPPAMETRVYPPYEPRSREPQQRKGAPERERDREQGRDWKQPAHREEARGRAEIGGPAEREVTRPQRSARGAEGRGHEKRSFAEKSAREPRGGGEMEAGAGEREFGPVSHEPGMMRLALNIGSTQKIVPGDVLGVILGVTKLPRDAVGAIHLQPKQTLVDVVEDRANLVLKKLNGIRFKGWKLAAKVAE